MHALIGAILMLGLTGGASLPDAAGETGLEIRKNYQLERVSQRVYVIYGPNEMPTPENQGFRNNPGIVLTDGGVVIIDPGSSVHTGNYVLKKIRELTASRVVAVFNTHSHGDHWLGNQAIKEAFPNAVIYAHARAKELAAQGEGERWIKAIDERAGGALKGTYPVAPDRAVQNGETVTIGGMHFRIHHNGPAHTDNDILIEVTEEKVLFFGDVVRSRNVGEFMSSFKGNIEAIDLGLKSGATRFVPGHGPGFDRQVAQAYRDLLSTIRAQVVTLYENGTEDFEMKPHIVATLGHYKSWSGFDDHIGRLINTAYLEVEKESFK